MFPNSGIQLLGKESRTLQSAGNKAGFALFQADQFFMGETHSSCGNGFLSNRMKPKFAMLGDSKMEGNIHEPRPTYAESGSGAISCASRQGSKISFLSQPNRKQTMEHTTDQAILDACHTIATEQLKLELKNKAEAIHAAAMSVLQPDQRTPAPESPEPTEEAIAERAQQIHDDPNPAELHLVWAEATHRGAIHHTGFSWGEWGNQWFTLGVMRHTS